MGPQDAQSPVGNLAALTEVQPQAVSLASEWTRGSGKRSASPLSFVPAQNLADSATLFCRLNVFPIEVPPLRERREDIPLLVQYFVSRLCRRMRRSVTSMPRETMNALMVWDWPGNIRELGNFIERAVILSPGDTLNAPLSELALSNGRIAPVLTFRDSKRNAIISALKVAKGKISGKDGAAERLALKRTTLLNKMSKRSVTRDEYKRIAKKLVCALLLGEGGRFCPSTHCANAS